MIFRIAITLATVESAHPTPKDVEYAFPLTLLDVAGLVEKILEEGGVATCYLWWAEYVQAFDLLLQSEFY